MAYTEVISHTHVFLPKSELRGGVEGVKRILTVASRFKDDSGGRVVVEMFKETPTHIGIPRHYYSDLQSIADRVVHKEEEGKAIRFDAHETDHPNTPQQNAVIQMYKKILSRGGTGFLLHAPTGWGKTVTLIRMIQILGRTTVVIVPKEDLIRQWEDRMLEHSTLKRSDIGMVQQGVCDFEGKKVVICMMHSLALRSKPYPSDFYTFPGLVVIDEAHKVGAEQLGRVACLFPAKYRIGASATMTRSDGMEVIAKKHIGQWNLGQLSDNMPRPKVCVKRWEQSSGLVYRGLSQMQRKGKLTTLLANNTARNGMIAAYAGVLFRKGRKSIIVSDRVQQLKFLRAMLVNLNHIPPGRIGLYIGGATDAARAVMKKECDVFLATYGAMDLGTDLPDVSAIIFATPRSNVTQIVGRTRRIVEGKEQPVVVDIVDTAYKDCLRSFVARKMHYGKMNADYVELVSQ